MSLRPFAVGLTGGIGTGKSEALRAFRAAGAATLCLDQVHRRLSRPGGPAHRAIVRAFGRWVLGPDGALDRRALAARVFARPALLRRLGRATHPIIRREMERFLRRPRRGVAVVDVPLLFESGLARRFDATVAVSAPRAAQMRRVMARDGATRAEALRRIRAQWPARRKEGLADVVIRNESSLPDLRRAVAAYQRAFALLWAGARAARRDA